MSLYMSTLNCGIFGLSKNVAENKSYIHVKLTDSAYKAIEEYLKSRDPSNVSPSISFCGNDGEISIPNCGIGNTKFNFTLQDADQQGSYESVKQSDTRDLESLGPIMAKMKIAAKQNDSFQITRDRMAADQESSNKKCAKELELINSSNAFGRQRSIPITVTGSRKKSPSISLEPENEQLLTSSNTSSLDYKTSYNSTSSNTTNNNSNAGNLAARPPTGLRISPTIKPNPELLKIPVRDRIIQLLAVKSYKKLEIHNRIIKEGCKERDKRTIIETLISVSVLKNNIYQLQTNIWGEVKDDWYFYTDEEKAIVRQNKAQHVSPSTREPSPRQPSQATKESSYTSRGSSHISIGSSHTLRGSSHTLRGSSHTLRGSSHASIGSSHTSIGSSHTSRGSSHTSRGSSHTSRGSSHTSRGSSHTSRGSSHTSRGSSHTSRGSSHTSRGSSHTSSEFSHTLRDLRVASVKRSNEDANGLDPIVKKRRSHDGLPVKVTNPDYYLSSLNRAKSCGDIKVVANGQHSHLNSYHGNIDNLNNHHNIKSLDTSKTSPMPLPNYNGLSRNKNGNHNTSSDVSKNDHVDGCNNNKNDKHYNGYLAVPGTYKTPRSSPDSHLDGDKDYLKKYIYIMTPEQRTRYEADFHRDYTTYFDIYQFLVSITKKFVKLEKNLKKEKINSEEYNIIKQEIKREYKDYQEDKKYQDSKKEYDYLHNKLKHVKQLIVEYDNPPTL